MPRRPIPKNHENHAEEATKNCRDENHGEKGKPAKGEEMEPQLGNRTRFWNAFFGSNLGIYSAKMFWWPVEVVVFIQMIFLLLCFWPSAFFDPVTALESVISLRFRALLGFAKVCPLSGPATCHVLWCFWLLELRHPCPFGQEKQHLSRLSNVFCPSRGRQHSQKKKTKHVFYIFYWFLIRESCWFWSILLSLMSCMGCEQKHYRYKMFIAETNVCPEPLNLWQDPIVTMSKYVECWNPMQS